jgi:glycosyltransferase involved in cell wall biosynthesis
MVAPLVPLDLSLVLACYNEEAVFEESAHHIFEMLDNTRWTYEIIFVDDCSRDRTRELIDRLIAQDQAHRLRRIFHARNIGRGGTVADGIRQACGEWVGYIDIDLEVHARYIPSCVSALRNGADVATAHRIYKFYWRGLIRWILSHGYMWLERILLGVPLKDTETGFKFFRRAAILSILDEVQDTRWFWDTEVMVRSYLRGYRIVEIPCLFQRRFDKRSTVNPIADTLDYFRKLWRFRQTVAKIRMNRSA